MLPACDAAYPSRPSSTEHQLTVVVYAYPRRDTTVCALLPTGAGTVTTYTIKTNYVDGTGTPQQSNTTYNTTAPGSGSSLPTTYWAYQTINNPSAGCYNGYSSRQDAIATAPTGTQLYGWTSASPPFYCTPALPAGSSIGAGSVTAYLYFTNTNNKTCTTSWYLNKGQTPTNAGTPIAGTAINGGPSITVPASTSSPTLYTVTGTVTPGSLATNDQLALQVNVATSSGNCSKMTLYFAATGAPSRFSVPTLTGSGGGSSLTGPNSPTGPAAVHNADGTTTVSWTASSAPSGTPAPDFYRVYRDGTNYTNRVDTTDATSTTVATASAASATTLTVDNASGFAAGQSVLVDTGANQDTMTVSSVAGNTITFTGGMPHAHSVGVPVVLRSVSWLDTNVGGGTHTYYVTAASSTLTESAATSGVTA